MRSAVVVDAVILGMGGHLEVQQKTLHTQLLAAVQGGCGPRAMDYREASRLRSSEMVMPTSFLPPKTVPFLPLAMCSSAVL